MGARNLDKGKTSVFVLSVQSWMMMRLTVTISAVHLCNNAGLLYNTNFGWRRLENYKKFYKFHVQNFPSTEIERYVFVLETG